MNPTKETKGQTTVSLRLTSDERDKLERAATGGSLSAHIRKCLFGGETAMRRVNSRMPTKDREALGKALGLLGQSQIARNLRQLSHHAHSGSLLLDEETVAKIDEAYDHVLAIRATLIRALGLLEDRDR